MPFDPTLRDRLHREAESVALPDREPGRAVARARQRRRRRTTAVGAVAAVVVAAAAVPLARAGDGGADRRGHVTAAADLLPPTGPLAFDWQTGDDGLGVVSSSFQAADGTVYALSTGPGFRGVGTDEWPRALYRLGADGTWEPVELDGDRPRAIDVTANGDALYAVSTGPGAGGGGTVARASMSTDGGGTWSGQDVPAVTPPSDEVAWLQDRALSVETAGDTTLALVTTSFSLDLGASFPELAGSGWVEPGEDGLVVWGPEGSAVEPVGAEGSPATPSTTTPAGEEEVVDPTEPAEPPAEGAVEIRTLTWEELGLSGPDDLDPTYQVLRSRGGAWEPLDGVTGLTGDSLTLGTAGDVFVAEAMGPEGTTVLTSPDGAAWAPVEVPGGGEWYPSQGVSVGPALVAVEPGKSVVYVSGDLGATWQQLDLSGAGVPPGFIVQSVDSGPLGVALVGTGPDGWDPQLVVSGDLVDWTVTPIAEVVGARPNTTIGVTVGADRLVVTATLAPAVPGDVSDSRTAVGTPVRG